MGIEIKWRFYDPETKMKTADMTLEEAQMSILKMRAIDINKFYFSRGDINEWRPLKQLMAAHTSPFAGLAMLGNLDKASHTAVNTQLKMHAVDEKTREEIERTFTNSCIDQNQTLADVDFTRPASLPIEYVLMTKQGHLFRTAAKDPTTDGSYCEKLLPLEFQTGIFDIVMINLAAANQYFSKLKFKGKVAYQGNGLFIEFILSDKSQRSQIIESINYCQHDSHRKKVI